MREPPRQEKKKMDHDVVFVKLHRVLRKPFGKLTSGPECLSCLYLDTLRISHVKVTVQATIDPGGGAS